MKQTLAEGVGCVKTVNEAAEPAHDNVEAVDEIVESVDDVEAVDEVVECVDDNVVEAVNDVFAVIDDDVFAVDESVAVEEVVAVEEIVEAAAQEQNRQYMGKHAWQCMVIVKTSHVMSKTLSHSVF